MAKAASRLTTVDEFLAFEGEPDTRYQLIRGAITARAPAKAQHGELVMRLGSRLSPQIPPHCRVIGEAGIKPVHRDDTYWQADLVVTCEPRERGQIYLGEPQLIIEILSPSTASIDRTLKLDDYRAMASVQDILLVDVDRQHIEHWQRASQHRGGALWQVRELGSGDSIGIAALGIIIALDELYADMPLDDGIPLEEGGGGSEV